jgi:UDP-N-acetylglucosamine 1-carboxyvinyltransferase
MLQRCSISLSAGAPWWRPSPGCRGWAASRRELPDSGAKNAVLPLMVSALLTPHLVTLDNVPGNLDVAVLAALLKGLGAELHWSRTELGLSVTICADHVHPVSIDAELVARMRASVLLLGALLARCGEASLPMPGGDAIGLRGIDFHLGGLRAMGAEIELSGGIIHATARSGLRGAHILLPQPSVGATENVLLAAVLARGNDVDPQRRSGARNRRFGQMPCVMGATISGIGTEALTVVGNAPLGGAVHSVMPDRIELGTLACATAITDGELFLKQGRLGLLGAAVPVLDAAGVELREVEDGLTARRSAVGLTGVDIVTRPHPGFATDLQAPVMALLSTEHGDRDDLRATLPACR